MNHGRSLVFEALEGRTLLSGARAEAIASAITNAEHQLLLNGTLTVKNGGAMSSPDTTTGSSTTINAVPVSGLLSGLGKVRGYWYEEVNGEGQDLALDVLELNTSEGQVTVEFKNTTVAATHTAGKATVSYQHSQVARITSGALDGASEKGTLALNMNRAKSEVQTITLKTTSS